MRKRAKNNLIVVLITLSFVIIALKVSILFTEEKKLYQPEFEIDLTPKYINLSFEDIYLKTQDNQRLNSWFVPVPNAKATILYCPGRGGNLSDRLDRIKFFHTIGYNVFTFDYRGYGNSTGRPSEHGLYRDAQAAYDYLLSRKDVDATKIIVYGKSLGGAVATDLCLWRKPAALVLEGSLSSLKTYVSSVSGFLPMEILVSEKFDTVSKISRITIPKLIIHGMDDEVISFAQGRLIFNKAAEPKEFLPFDGRHDYNIFTQSDAFRDKFNKFLKDHNVIK